MQNYKKFNCWIYKKFEPLFDTYSSVASIFIDIYDNKNLSPVELSEISLFLKNYKWERLCYTSPPQYGSIPMYLGLISIQLIAAADRHDDKDFTANAYNPRLKKLLSIDNNRLQKQYELAQEQIYADFEKWCIKHNLSIYLSKTAMHHRYVQYPLSLALLHKDDIKSLGLFFHKSGIAHDDEIDFELFSKIINNNQRFLSKRIRKLIENTDQELKKAIEKQMYLACKNWDGSYIEDHRPDKKYTSNKKQCDEYTIVWEAGNRREFPEFFADSEKVKDLSFIGKGKFFVQDMEYPSDWNFTLEKYIDSQTNIKCVFIYINPLDDFIKKMINVAGCEKKYEFDNYKLILLSDQDIYKLKDLFPEKFKCQPLICLSGGLKLSHREWMKDAGPIIEPHNYKKETILFRNAKESKWIEKKISEQPLRELSCGTYYLQYGDDSPFIHFKICDPLPFEGHRSLSGWEASDNGFTVSNTHNFHVSGMDFSKIPNDYIQIQGNIIRQWVTLATEKKVKKINNENLVHKILRRNNNGICYR